MDEFPWLYGALGQVLSDVMLVCENPTLTGVESRRPNGSGEDAAAKVGVSGGASHASDGQIVRYIFSTARTSLGLMVLLPIVTGA